MENKSENKDILRVMKDLEDRFKEPVLQRMNNNKSTISTVSTGRGDLNSILGGGFGEGKIIEIFGESGTGKTGIALDAAAECQRKGGTVAFMDFENALNTEYCNQTGVNIDDILIAQPSFAEQGFMAIRMLIATGKVDMIIIDSVAQMIPRAELEGETGESKMGLAARTMGQGIRQITGISSKKKCTIIFINQIRKSLALYGNPNTTPGGNALPFAATQRLHIKNKGQVKVGEEVVGFKQHIRIVKNKVSAPFKEIENPLFYGKGVDKLSGLIDSFVFEEILTRKGAWYAYEDENIAQGLKKLRILLEDNPEFLEELSSKLK